MRIPGPDRFLVFGFLAILASAGVIQAVFEVGKGERPQALEVFTKKPTVSHLRAYEQHLEEASWVAGKLRPWMQCLQFIWLREAGAKALVGRDNWLFYKPGLDYLTGRPNPRSKPEEADPLPAIISFRDQLQARGIHLLVLVAPNKESIYPEKLTRRAEQLHVVETAHTRGLFDRLKAANVAVVDLFQVFEQAKATRDKEPPLYLVQDTHWSPAGVGLAAKAVAQRILELGWAKAGTVAYRSEAFPLERMGDVLRMLQVPELERRAIPERVSCLRVKRPDNNALYQDDPNSAILVLGDSFLRIYETDEPGAAGFIAHLAEELNQPLASIVSDGGASTLVRQELCRRSALLEDKKLVIWEFVERDIRFGAEGWQVIPLPAQSGAIGSATSGP